MLIPPLALLSLVFGVSKAYQASEIKDALTQKQRTMENYLYETSQKEDVMFEEAADKRLLRSATRGLALSNPNALEAERSMYRNRLSQEQNERGTRTRNQLSDWYQAQKDSILTDWLNFGVNTTNFLVSGYIAKENKMYDNEIMLDKMAEYYNNIYKDDDKVKTFDDPNQ